MELLDRKTKELEQQLSEAMEELSTTQEKLTHLSAQEAALVQQNAKMSMELVASDKNQKTLQTELSGLKDQLALRETEVDRLKKELNSISSKHKGDAATLQQDLEEKTKRLKEYQDKVSHAPIVIHEAALLEQSTAIITYKSRTILQLFTQLA